jgi:hypothetical protein
MIELDSGRLSAFHDGKAAAEPRTELWRAIADNHNLNQLIWKEEDLARRRHVPDSEIAANKRAIDQGNQCRNDAIERIDEVLLSSLSEVETKENARLNSETPGSMIDRLSILSLKIHHMRLQTLRTDVGREHVQACQAKLDRLAEQRGDLSACLDRLLAEAARGETRFKVYRQFKMYNDPALNPAIYGESKGR